ncbi:Exodeoxyribonuclease III, partial [hydrothermal vent metagenome]
MVLSMRIITVNTNGIRAAARKGFFDWLKLQHADVVCIQETKAQVHQLEDEAFHPQGYHCYYHDAQKKGYSGVAVYCKVKPKKVHAGIGMHDVDMEGRYMEIEFEKISVISLYMHSGSSSEERLQLKLDFMQRFMTHLHKLRRKRREFVICGDWNIAHKQIDIKNWRSNQQNSGFLPEEREWLSKLFDEVGYVDAFRAINQKHHEYTWWSHRANAWGNNTGWRIDYQIVTPKLKPTITAADIYKDERFSDHAPLT